MRSTTSTPSGKPRLTTSSMIASIAAEGQKTKPAPFGHALVELARNRSDVIGMTADLGKYTDLHIFAKEFPDRYYQVTYPQPGALPIIVNGQVIGAKGVSSAQGEQCAQAAIDAVFKGQAATTTSAR